MSYSLQVKLLSHDAIAPTRAHSSDAGLDLYAAEDIIIPLGNTRVINTEVAVALPLGTVGKIEDRSSLAAKGLRTGGGVVDSSYRGPIKVVLHNISNVQDNSFGYRIHKGDKIAQLLVYQVDLPTVQVVTELDETKRGESGFGSTGK